jgi:hypothetical protein
MRSISFRLLAAAAAFAAAATPAGAGCGAGHGSHGNGGRHRSVHASARAAEARRQDAAASAWQDLRVVDVGRWDDWRGGYDYGGASAVDYTEQISALAAMQRADEVQQCATATIRTSMCARLLSEQAGAADARVLPPP